MCLANCVCYIVSSGFSYCYSLRYVFHFIISFFLYLLPLSLSLSLSPASVASFGFGKFDRFTEGRRSWRNSRASGMCTAVAGRSSQFVHVPSPTDAEAAVRAGNSTSPTVFALILEFNELAVINISRRDSSLVVTRLFVPRRLRLIASTVRSRSRLIVVCSSVSSASVSRVENTIGASLLASCSSPSNERTASNNRQGGVHAAPPPPPLPPDCNFQSQSSIRQVSFISSSRRRGCKTRRSTFALRPLNDRRR